MTVTVTSETTTPLVAPPSVRQRAGHRNGQHLEFRVSGGVITILPKPPAADKGSTPRQRRMIDARLAVGLADYSERAGRSLRGLPPGVRRALFK